MEKKLRICMVTTFYPPYNFGGDGIFVHQLANELAKRGHLVDVFHCIDAFSLLNKFPIKQEYNNHPNIKTIELKSFAGFLSPLSAQQTGSLLFKKELKKALEQNPYDVIHYHNISLIGVTALSYGSPSAVKLYTLHEHWLICPMHVLWKFDREICLKKDCITCQIIGGKPPQLWRYTGLLEKMTNYVDAFISPSQFTLKKHRADGLNIPIKYIPNFISAPEANHILPKQNGIDKPHYFLFVGRLEKIKGLQNVIPIFKKKQKYELLIVGDGKYQEELKNMSKGTSNIKFLGKLGGAELESLYRQAIAIIVPSICYETFGIVAIEAFSLKTPVLVNNLGALPEVVDKSGGGFIYNNEEELSDLIDKLAENPQLRDDLGNKGYKGFLNYWNSDAYLEQYFSLIEKIQKQIGKGN